MLADPIVIPSSCSVLTHSDNVSLPAIARGDSSSQYRNLNFDAGGTQLDLLVSHQFGKRNRYTMRFTASAPITDPLSGLTVRASNSYYVVADENPIYLPTYRSPILVMLGIELIKVGSTEGEFHRVLGGET